MNRTYAKLVDGQLVTTCASDDDIELIEQIRTDGFKLYNEDAGQPDIGKFQSLCPVYRETDDAIILYWEIIDDSPEKIETEIVRLTKELTSTDYRVVQSYEYALAGVKSTYDMKAIHAEREALRSQIRDLEKLLVPKEDILQPLVPDDEIPPGIVDKKRKSDGEIAATPI